MQRRGDQEAQPAQAQPVHERVGQGPQAEQRDRCLLYTSDAADERSSVDLGGRRIIKKKKNEYQQTH